MRVAEAIASLNTRIRRPGLWAVAIGGGALWAMVRLATGGPYGRLGQLEAFLALPILAGMLIIGPLPWQVGGEDGELPHPLRGLLQAVPWNAAWILLLLLGLQALHPPPPPPPGAPARQLHTTHFSMFLLSFFVPLVTAAGGLLAHAQASEARAERERRLAEETRQLALQAQMQPHALYNAISGLAELAREDGPATEEALIALSRYLRRLQKHCQSRTQPLGEERALLESYLAIARIRLGDRLQISWQWPDWADALELPPLLLQPLVENAVEHGIAARAVGGKLRIFVSQEGDGILLGVANDGAPPREDAAEGQGLGHLRERLALWSSQRATLALVREGSETIARLHLPGVTA
jgi:hypothetical protein